MSDNAAVAEPGVDLSENQEAQSIDVNNLTDVSQFGELMQDPEAFEKYRDSLKATLSGKQEVKKEAVVQPVVLPVKEEEDGETEAAAEEQAVEGSGQDEATGEEEAVDAEEEVKRPRRLRIKAEHLDDKGRQLVKLISLGKQPDEAYREVFGEAKAEQPKAKEKPQLTPSQVRIARAQIAIDKINEELKAARAAYDVEKIEELRDQRDSLKDEMRSGRDQFEYEQFEAHEKVARAHRQAFDSSVQASVALFPDAGVEGSELFEAISDRKLVLQQRNPDFFKQADWPELLVAAEAAKLGIPSTKLKQANGATPKAQPGAAKVQPKKVVTRLTPSASSTSDGQTETKLESEADLVQWAGDDPERLALLLNKFGSTWE